MSKLTDVQPSLNGNVTSVVPPIEFACTVDGKKMSARITHLEDHPIHIIFRVSFGDGHRTAFFSIEHELGFYEEGEGNSMYAKGIRDDLKSLCFLRLDKEVYCIDRDKSGEDTNVWILQDWEDDRNYKVYTRGHYRFNVIRTGKGWLEGHINPKEMLTGADDILAAKVCKFIDSCQR